MSDRELLELAAKAAEIEYGADRLDCGLSITLPSGHHKSLPRWNPLDDDGDALRLAVKLGLDICIELYHPDMQKLVAETGVYSEAGAEIEPHGDDPCAATRRAITRAAAELGRRMQHE